jgi:tetratricopeptide (TPR) repeat protein
MVFLSKYSIKVSVSGFLKPKTHLTLPLVVFLFIHALLSGNNNPINQDSLTANDLIGIYKETGDTIWLSRAINSAKNQGEESVEGEVLRQFGLYYSNYENAEKSIEYLLKAMNVFEITGDTVGLAKVNLNLNLGFLHYGLTETGLALDYTKKAVEFARQVDDPWMLSIILGNLGSMYERLEDGLEPALAAHHESLELSIQLQDSAGMFSTYNNLGVLYEKREQFEQALMNYTRALNIALPLDETLEACRIQSNLTSLNIRMGE